ncbi:MAG: hypothetical protein A2794_01455 [Alphaproteobacteria bacterium RIFCSPHIGHO2_01_FULL_40_8]|nr:MAG: hypothetical protein A2794_01455 [Alphaproteobacteria bacterium RIFCSPHIGHO2_01_FULL_40_8]
MPEQARLQGLGQGTGTYVFLPGEYILKNLIKIIILAMLATQILGCATISNKLGEAVATVYLAQTMDIIITSNIFYACENHWPQNIDELRTFAEKNKLDLDKLGLDKSKKEIPIIPISHPRFDGTKFTTLLNGDLEVKLNKYQKFDEVTFTVPKSEAKKKHNYKPQEGYVPDEETAIKIAVAVWIPIYGKDEIEKEKPYKATLKDGIWHVTGFLPEGWLGGVAEAEIAKDDGRIIRISHGK